MLGNPNITNPNPYLDPHNPQFPRVADAKNKLQASKKPMSLLFFIIFL